MIKSKSAEIKQSAAGKKLEYVCKADTSYEDAMKSVYGKSSFTTSTRQNREEVKKAEEIKAAEAEAPVEKADAQVITPEEKTESKKSETKKDKSAKDTKIGLGMIKPFFQAEVIPEPEKKLANFGITTEILKKETPEENTTEVTPVVENQMKYLKGDMIGDNFAYTGMAPVYADIAKPIIAKATLLVDADTSKGHQIWHDAYTEIANAIGMDSTEKGACHMAHFFEESYAYYSGLIGTVANINIPGAEPLPIVGVTPVVEDTMDPKKASCFKKVYEAAESLGLSARVVPVNGLYRVDVYDNKTTLIDPQKSFWADIDGKIMNRKQKWFPVYTPEVGKSFED